MANIKAAIKYIRKSRKNKARNLAANLKLKGLLKTARKNIVLKAKETVEAVKQAISALDKAVQNGLIHKNTAARKKSRLMKKFNAIAKK